MNIRALSRQLLLIAGMNLLAGSGHADVLGRYNMGPNGTTPGVLTPTMATGGPAFTLGFAKQGRWPFQQRQRRVTCQPGPTARVSDPPALED